MGISLEDLKTLISIIRDQQVAIRMLIEARRLGESLDDEMYHQMIASVNHTDEAVARMMSRLTNDEV